MRYAEGVLGNVLGSAGALFSAMMFFMMTAFGGGGLVAPGRPPLSRAVERYLNLSLMIGPILVGLLGLPPWFGASKWFFAAPPLALVAQVLIIFSLFGRR